MNFLSIDCSTNIGSLFVKKENKTFIKILQNNKFNNDLLMKEILVFLEENDIKFDQITSILVNQGPGNFSGLRGSIATAKGISLAKNLELYGYDTFLWLTANFFNKKNYIYSLIKFRERYFIKGYDYNLNCILKIKEISENEMFNKYNKEFKVIAKSSAKHLNDKILRLNNLNIIDLDHKELESLKIKDLLDKDLIKPLYLS